MILWIAATLIAFFVKGLCGFADGLLFGTMMSFANNNVIITPVQTLMSLPSNVILAWKNRKEIRLSFCLPVIAVMLAGDTMGALLLKNMDTHVLKILLGLIVAGLGVEMLLRERNPKKVKSSPVLMAAIGIASGIISGLFSVGTLLTAYFSRVTDDTGSFKGNICLVFASEVFYRILIYLFTGMLTTQVLFRALTLFPFMIAALLLGMKSGSVLSEKTVRRIVIIVLIISGIALTLSNIR